MIELVFCLFRKKINYYEDHHWREALVTPVLKKGDPTQLGNYRPVSCLPAASKILERIIFDQTTEYIEKKHSPTKPTWIQGW